jgi:hypothetical protein
MPRTFLVVAGLTDLGNFGWYLGPKQGIHEIGQRNHIDMESGGHCSILQEL